jgi:aryl-alcohol dehydrogenase-like predicted oxidoreductase
MMQSFSEAAHSDLPLMLGGNVFGWSADTDDSFAVLDAFVAAGGRMIDTADSYSHFVAGNVGGESETILGQWLTSRGNRDQVFLATKVGSLPGLNNLRATTIGTAIEESLTRLQTDYLDLYWAHKDDESTPQDETAVAFDKLVQAGKVRFLGASNFSADRLSTALKISAEQSLTPYSAIQPQYNLMEYADYEPELAPVAQSAGLACLPYYGLAKGFLTGKYRPGVTIDSPRAQGAAAYLDDRGLRVLAELDAIAQARDAAVATVSLAWLNQQPTVLAPIASARNQEQLLDLLALADFTLTDTELDRLRAAAALQP